MSDSFATPWIVARQVSLSMGYPRQEYWNGLPFPPPGDLLDPGIELESPVSPALTETLGLPRWLSGKETACQAGDVGTVSVLGRSPGKGNRNPL